MTGGPYGLALVRTPLGIARQVRSTLGMLTIWTRRHLSACWKGHAIEHSSP